MLVIKAPTTICGPGFEPITGFHEWLYMQLIPPYCLSAYLCPVPHNQSPLLYTQLWRDIVATRIHAAPAAPCESDSSLYLGSWSAPLGLPEACPSTYLAT